MIGGLSSIPTIAGAFGQVTYFDTSAFMNALHRQRLIEGNDGRLIKSPEKTEPGAPVDELLAKNVDAMRTRVQRLINESRRRPEASDNVPTLESPESALSDPAAPSSTLAGAR